MTPHEYRVAAERLRRLAASIDNRAAAAELLEAAWKHEAKANELGAVKKPKLRLRSFSK